MPSTCANRTPRRSSNHVSRRKPKVAFPAKYRNRPALIRHAIYKAWEIMEDINLSISGVAVLQAVIALGVDVNEPYKSVYAKKEVLADYAGVSESSVYRTLTALEERQLIIRYEQQQRVDGSLSVSQLSLTTKLLLLLGFDIDNKHKEDDGQDSTKLLPENVIEFDSARQIATLAMAPADVEVRSINVTEEGGAALIEESRDNAFEEMDDELVIHQSGVCESGYTDTNQARFSADLTDGLKDGLKDAAYIGQQKVDQREEQKATPSVDNQSTGGGHVKIGKFSVPVELSWVITEKRLSCPQLFKLMNLSKTVQGQKIEDFIELRKDRIRTLSTTNDCYRFINSLIKSNIDAKFLVAQRNEQAAKAVRAIAIKKAERDLQAWYENRDGLTFIDSKIDKSYTINSRNLLLLVGKNGLPDAKAPSVKATQKFIDRVMLGELVLFVPKPANDRIKDAPKARLSQLWNAVKGR